MLSKPINEIVCKWFFQLLVIAVTFLYLGNSTWAAAPLKGKYPNKKITMMVAFAPGGMMDMEARQLSIHLKKYLNVDIVIQNVPGAGGRIGQTKLYHSQPDGYTIGGITIPNIILVETISKADFRSNKFTKIFAWSVANSAFAVPTYALSIRNPQLL